MGRGRNLPVKVGGVAGGRERQPNTASIFQEPTRGAFNLGPSTPSPGGMTPSLLGCTLQPYSLVTCCSACLGWWCLPDPDDSARPGPRWALWNYLLSPCDVEWFQGQEGRIARTEGPGGVRSKRVCEKKQKSVHTRQRPNRLSLNVTSNHVLWSVLLLLKLKGASFLTCTKLLPKCSLLEWEQRLITQPSSGPCVI